MNRCHLLTLTLVSLWFPTPIYAGTVIAHRGASGYLPEHTLASAAVAHSQGADFIEPDVVLTKDNIPIVLHDIHLETTTNVASVFPMRKRSDGKWYAIDFTLAEIKTLTAGERRKGTKPAFPKRFPAEVDIFTVPTLEELILLVQGMNKSRGRTVGLYPELKAPAFHKAAGKDIGKVVVDLLDRYGYRDAQSSVYIQCFDPATLKELRPYTKLKFIQLIGDNKWAESDVDYNKMRTEPGLKEVATYAQGIGVLIGHVLSFGETNTMVKPTDLVALAHNAGLVVHAYTLRIDDLPPVVPSEALHRILFEDAKVDGLFTDFTDVTVRYLNTRHAGCLCDL